MLKILHSTLLVKVNIGRLQFKCYYKPQICINSGPYIKILTVNFGETAIH